MEEKILLRTENVSRVFHVGKTDVHALNDISFTIKEGGLTILNGKSGSGKTTLINQLSALDRPTSGKIWFEDKELTALSEKARDNIRRTRMGIVFQSIALISTMTALENVEFGLRVAGVPAAGRRERAMECLNYVGLGKRASHMPQEMSGGEQQRVAIAKAIAHRPSIIFADEPTAQLDSQMGLQVVNVFKQLIKEQGTTIIMTTHDPDLLQIADAVLTLQDGCLANETKGVEKS